MNTKLINDWIKLNKPNGLTKLAGKAGVSSSTLSNILNEKHSPRLDVVQALAQALDVSFDSLIKKGK